MISEGSDPRTSSPSGTGPAPVFSSLRGRIDAFSTSFHVALDTLDARRLRDDPDLVSIPGFLLLDTAEYEPVIALAPLQIFWRMQGMDILAHTRAANRDLRTGARPQPMSGSVWLVDATLDCFRPAEPDAAGKPLQHGLLLRIGALHALDRVAIEPGGPRHIESIDTRAMLPRFAEGA